jgi:excinuclease ABC subunit C
LFWESLPSLPGIYIFQDKKENPLYIGKSINIKTRIKQHLEASQNKLSKQAAFTSQTKSLKYIRTDSDLSAIILEAELIKTLKPRYNSRSKDDKSAIYIIFENPPVSKISLTRANDLNLKDFKNPKTQIYGPYQSKNVANLILKHARRIFGFCNTPFNKSRRACFYYHIKLCPGACKAEITHLQYQQHLGQIKKFLSGHFISLQKKLRLKIKNYAKNHNFEQALVLKKQLESLQNILSTSTNIHFLSLPAASNEALRQLFIKLDHPVLKSPPVRIECYDIANLGKTNQVGAMSVLIQGIPQPSEYRRFIINPPESGDPQAMRQVLSRRLRHSEWNKPDLIVLDGGVGQLNTVSKVVPKEIAILALSKKKETIHFYKDGKLINLNISLRQPAIKLLQTARDEVHRFVTGFHKKRRAKQMLY